MKKPKPKEQKRKYAEQWDDELEHIFSKLNIVDTHELMYFIENELHIERGPYTKLVCEVIREWTKEGRKEILDYPGLYITIGGGPELVSATASIPLKKSKSGAIKVVALNGSLIDTLPEEHRKDAVFTSLRHTFNDDSRLRYDKPVFSGVCKSCWEPEDE